MALSAHEVIRIRSESFRNETDSSGNPYIYQAARSDESGRLYPVDPENFSKRYPTDKIFASYDIALPTPENGIAVSEEIDNRICLGQHVRLLDIGCGAGAFILNKKKKYGDQIHCVGISSRDFSTLYYIDSELKRTYAEELSSSGVKVISGDAHSLRRLLKENGESEPFDVVVAQASLQYMGDPLSVVKQAYHVLQMPTGDALPGILYAGLDGTNNLLETMVLIGDNLTMQGYDAEVLPQSWKDYPGSEKKMSSGGVVIRKTLHPRLKLSVAYDSGHFANAFNEWKRLQSVAYVPLRQ